MKKNILVYFLTLMIFGWVEIASAQSVLEQVGDAIEHNGTEAVNVITLGQVGRNRDEDRARNAENEAAIRRQAEVERAQQTRVHLESQLSQLTQQFNFNANLQNSMRFQIINSQKIVDLIDAISGNFEEKNAILERLAENNINQKMLLQRAQHDFESISDTADKVDQGNYDNLINSRATDVMFEGLIRRAKSYNLEAEEYLKLVIANQLEDESSEVEYLELLDSLRSSFTDFVDQVESHEKKIINNSQVLNRQIKAIRLQLGWPVDIGSVVNKDGYIRPMR